MKSPAQLPVSCCLLALLGAALACGPPPPSIVLVTLDTVRQDAVGTYGATPSPTPHLDALADEGLVHDAAFTTMPTTGPAHLSLFTGRYPSELGTTRNAVPLREVDGDRSLALQLREAGYATGAFVTSTLMAPDLTGLPGFDTYDSPTGVLRPGEDAVDAALAWLDEQARPPAFVWLHLYDAHAPYGDMAQKGRNIPLDESQYGWVDRERYHSGDEAAKMEADYATGVGLADAALGRFVAGARARLGDPLVVVVSDHGESLAEHLASRGYAFDHGEFLDEETLRVPLVVAGPDVSPGRSSGAASIRDLYTTLLEAAGLGDTDAAARDRRDLRHADAAQRVVGIERRSFAMKPSTQGIDHAGAASDGRHFVIVDSEGEAVEGSNGNVAQSARVRAQQATEAARRTLPEFSDQTREALRQLGYAE